MTIQEKIGSIEARLRLAQQNEKAQAQARIYEALRRDISELYEPMAAILPSLSILLTTNELMPKSIPSAKKAIESWEKTNERYLDGGIDEFRKGKGLTTLKKQVTRIIEEGSATIKETWERMLKERAVGLPKQTLDSLENVPGQKSKVARVRKLVQEVNEIPIPETEAHFQEFERLCIELSEAVAGIKDENIPEAVLAFFRSSTSHRGATLEDLTEDVLVWMEEHNLTDSIRIRFVG